jgi:shikimate kinase
VPQPSRIVLIGFMGAGKSTVGPRVAELLGWTFRDMDQVIEERFGLSVPEIFRLHGESVFRAEERRIAEEIARTPGLVVAAGGGAFTFADTREALRAGAFTVWLRCELAQVLDRIPLDGSRPLAPDRETIVRLYGERQPSYRQADWVVDTTTTGPDVVARAVVEAFLGRGAEGPGGARQR